jgi:hypothetical protein
VVTVFRIYGWEEVTTSSEQKTVTTFIGTKNPSSDINRTCVFVYQNVKVHISQRQGTNLYSETYEESIKYVKSVLVYSFPDQLNWSPACGATYLHFCHSRFHLCQKAATIKLNGGREWREGGMGWEKGEGGGPLFVDCGLLHYRTKAGQGRGKKLRPGEK